MKQSGFLSLGARDILRGLAMAVLTPAVAIITDSIERGEINFNWRLIAISAIGGALAYLLKNFFTPKDTAQSKGDIVGDRPKDRG